ncbi:hypothetical protein P170DRAFT_363768 [Aspergillus steynii IBT 23096]|uniref:PHD-type domain-containing protein n=1 Tax=Aspergillus steynii IBT 23096 TaxID=1392250 RepID=A0A2I2G208_9EURO|nr:uncharacterized protein P170DRAFT_363768 [Aspergillus steynii IBT 23096]PLB46899.1 hypothetical protein P170DRAFT_363768 [Aspergillus steynii IBT 23096]
MSPQHGTSSSLASIETTPPTTSGSQPPAPSIDSSSVSISSLPEQRSSSASSFSSSKVHIPKLSAATTELLARVTGNIRREQQQQQPPQQQGNETNPIRWTNPYSSQGLSDFRSIQPASKMRASSTIIELPTAPFVYSSHMTSQTPATSQQTPSPNASNLPRESHGNPPNLVAIAPRPSGPPAAAPSAATQIPTPSQPVAPTAPTAPAAKPASSTTPLVKPKGPAVGSRQRKSTTSINGGKRTKRRRRGNHSDGEDVIRADDSSSDESDITPTATQTKSGRQVNRPSLYVPSAVSPVAAKTSGGATDTPGPTAAARKRKRVSQKGKDININCMHCQRGHSPMSNVIVFCDQCNQAWHQLCHDPPIETEFVTVKEREWHCRGCKPVRITITQPTVVRSNPNLSGPSFGSQTHLPLAPPRLETGGEGLSTDERRGFLSTLSHAALVELLVTLSSTHPAMPMFPEDLKSLPSSKFSFQPNLSAVSTPLSTSSTTPALTNSANSTSTPGAGEDMAPTNFDPRKRYIDEPSEDDSEDEVVEHRLYPRAGNGVRLPVSVDDLDIMREDPRCPTFSYMLHGSAQAQVKANGMAPVWGN